MDDIAKLKREAIVKGFYQNNHRNRQLGRVGVEYDVKEGEEPKTNFGKEENKVEGKETQKVTQADVDAVHDKIDAISDKININNSNKLKASPEKQKELSAENKTLQAESTKLDSKLESLQGLVTKEEPKEKKSDLDGKTTPELQEMVRDLVANKSMPIDEKVNRFKELSAAINKNEAGRRDEEREEEFVPSKELSDNYQETIDELYGEGKFKDRKEKLTPQQEGGLKARKFKLQRQIDKEEDEFYS